MKFKRIPNLCGKEFGFLKKRSVLSPFIFFLLFLEASFVLINEQDCLKIEYVMILIIEVVIEGIAKDAFELMMPLCGLCPETPNFLPLVEGDDQKNCLSVYLFYCFIQHQGCNRRIRMFFSLNLYKPYFTSLFLWLPKIGGIYKKIEQDFPELNLFLSIKTVGGYAITTDIIGSLASKRHSGAHTKYRSKLLEKRQCAVPAKKGVTPGREELQPELPQCWLLATDIQTLMVHRIEKSPLGIIFLTQVYQSFNPQGACAQVTTRKNALKKYLGGLTGRENLFVYLTDEYSFIYSGIVYRLKHKCTFSDFITPQLERVNSFSISMLESCSHPLTRREIQFLHWILPSETEREHLGYKLSRLHGRFSPTRMRADFKNWISDKENAQEIQNSLPKYDNSVIDFINLVEVYTLIKGWWLFSGLMFHCGSIPEEDEKMENQCYFEKIIIKFELNINKQFK
ncbi:hypothetical protein VP01_2167g2 [Puccinia sorghi]|uniref:Uncharacterized protein n=1 Tax=Puccinia sorghi TaxID=27349 RepID=A0A0L6V9I2_9BASI|nr:hypothetical protein VP01_2167g2 [Puccinia sorghi]